MNLEDLKVLSSVAKTKNLTLSASQLYKTESTLSKAIKRLESELGIVCFYHEHNRLQLTNEGKQAAEIADKALQTVSRLYGVGKHKEKELLSVYAVGLEFLRYAEQQIMNTYIGNQFELQEHYASDRVIKAAFEDDICDIAFTLKPIKTKKPVCLVKYADTPVLVMRKGLINGIKTKESLRNPLINKIMILTSSSTVEKFISDNNLPIKVSRIMDASLIPIKLMNNDSPLLMSKINSANMDRNQFNIIDIVDNELKLDIFVTIKPTNGNVVKLIKESFSSFQEYEVIEDI